MKNYFTILIFSLFIGKTLAQSPYVSGILGPGGLCYSATPPVYVGSTSGNATGYTWNVYPSAGVVISNPTGSTTTISFPNIDAYYYIYFQAYNSYGSDGTQIVVTVYESPMITFSGASVICAGESANLSASPTINSASSTMMGSSTLSYLWEPNTWLNNNNTASVTANPPYTTTYSLMTTFGPCSRIDTVTLSVDACLGIKANGNKNDRDLLMYPNPANGTFTIRSDKQQTVYIVNELGQTIRLVTTMPEVETKVSDLEPGIYFVVTAETRKKIIITASK